MFKKIRIIVLTFHRGLLIDRRVLWAGNAVSVQQMSRICLVKNDVRVSKIFDVATLYGKDKTKWDFSPEIV